MTSVATHFTIIKTVGTEKIPAAQTPAGPTITIAIDKRTPARTYTVFIPAEQWPTLTDVPTTYRPLVNAALVNSAESILKNYLDTANRDHTSIPMTAFTEEALLATSDLGRMTAERLLGLWRQSTKYVYSIAPKLVELAPNAARLAAYKQRLELHEKRLATLTTKTPETKLSNGDLDKLLVNMDDADFDTPYGAYLAERIETVRSKLAEDSDAL